MLLVDDYNPYIDYSLVVTTSLCHYLAGPNVTMSSVVTPKPDQLPSSLLDKVWPKRNRMNEIRLKLSQQGEIRTCSLHPNIPDQAPALAQHTVLGSLDSGKR